MSRVPQVGPTLAEVVAGEAVRAGLISVNFSAGAWPLPTRLGESGRGLRGHWNNCDGARGHGIALRDSLGQPTSARLSFEAASAYAEFRQPATFNRLYNRLYRGGLVGDDTSREVSVELSGIPYPVYDVYVFASADTSDGSTLSLSDDTTTFYYRSAGGGNAGAKQLLLTESEDPQEPTVGPAQYQVFRRRSGPAFRLSTGGSRNCVLSNNVFGLQIVEAHEADGGGAMGDERRQVGRSRQPRRQRGAAPGTQQAPKSEIFLPFVMGATVRVRYTGPGGGSLNLHSGADIALHVNPRPHEGLVLNSWLGGGWGPEERPDDYPFPGGAEVSLSVWAGPEGFHIQAGVAGERPFRYLYAYRLQETCELDRITVDIPGVRAIAVQPEL